MTANEARIAFLDVETTGLEAAIIKTVDYKLATACNYFGVELQNAHDAYADIEATRALNDKISGCLKNIFNENAKPNPVTA